jgi:fibronectin type 3 domain-containing protein
MSSNRFVFSFVCLFSLSAAAQNGPPIPAAYQSLYTELQGDVTSFSQTISASWNGTHYPTVFASQLLTANSDQGSSLLGTNYYTATVLPELQELQALGVTAVSLNINFPILYQPYYTNQQDFQNFVTFYQQLAQQIRANGMKLTVETTVASASPGSNGGNYAPYYSSLSWSEYMEGRAQQTVNIAQLLQPDYISVITEPDSESQNSGQANAGTPAGSLQELQTILAAMQAAANKTPVGAGAGTWISSFTTYIQNVISTPASFVDVHLYSVSNAYPENALTAAAMAHAAGLPIAMSETWCKKISASQLAGIAGALNNQAVDALGTFSFWEPLDQMYLQSLVNMAQAGQFLYVSPFWSQLYYAYLDYGTYGAETTSQILIADQDNAGYARQSATFSPVGTAWESMILPTPDTTPPQVPSPPSIGQYGQTAVQVLWNPTTDNIGVAGYNLFRNNQLLETASQVGYTDNSVSPSTAYSYQVQAFDAAGNLSALSAPATVTTRAVPDTTPPSEPANLNGTALTDQSISLTWSPSTDNVAVAGYRVLGGATAASLSPIGSVITNSFTDTLSLHPSTAYYFAVEAFDTSGNYSAQSAVIEVSTLPDTTPPTVPANVAATGTGSQQVSLSWSPSTDNIHMSGYVIYRGTTSSSLAAVGSTTNTTYVDTLSLQPGTTYYYSVAAHDEAGNYSAQSSPVAATTLPDTQPPSVPQNVKAVANSDTQISLTWPASTDNVAVAGYRIYGGTVATSLSPLASVTTTSFADTRSVRPNTTYYYAVEAFDKSGNYSAQSPVVHATTLPDTIPPTVPTNVTAIGTGVEQVTLNWSPSTDTIGVSGYVIYRSKTGSSLTAVGSSTTPGYVDTLSLQPNTTYYYSVAAYDQAGNYSAQSPVIAATTLADTQPPTVPQNLAAVATSGTTISLTWSPSTDNVAVYYYRIYGGASAQTLNLLGTSSTTSFNQSVGLKANTTYYFAVSAVDTNGNASAQSGVVSVTNP